MGALEEVAGHPVIHTFDGGLDVPQRTLVQQGVVDTLLPLTLARGGYLLDVFKVGCVVRSYTDDAGIAQLFSEIQGRTPCIAVATGDRPFENLSIGGKNAKGELTVLLYFCTQHSRGNHIGRLESDVASQTRRKSDPGLHVVMQHAMELLLGSYPSTTTAKVKQMKITREDELATIPEITIWVQTWQTTTFGRQDGSEWRSAPQLLESIHWRVTTDPDEDNRPDPATVSTSLDVDSDLTP